MYSVVSVGNGVLVRIKMVNDGVQCTSYSITLTLYDVHRTMPVHCSGVVVVSLV